MDKVVIIGDKSSAILISDYIYDAINRFGSSIEILGFASDRLEKNTILNDFPVIARTEGLFKQFEKHKDVKFVYQMYDIRDMITAINVKNSLNIPDKRYLKFIHPSCFVAKSASIGYGTIVLANCVINSNANIGLFNSIMSGVTIGHDAKVGDYNLIATQAIVANIVMGNRNFIGINATTNNKIKIGDDCMIGMASNVVDDVESNVKCFGNPARIVITPKRLK
jgi:acetyltransferase EpsM